MRRSWILPVTLALLALIFYGIRIEAEPHFLDESAYFAQSHYFELYWLEGAWDDRAWIEYSAYDLPPLPKYVVGAALWLFGEPRPDPNAAVAWYRGQTAQYGNAARLRIARWPSALFGMLGVLAVYGLGRRLGGPRTATIAALLLMVNPLYRLHAARAMSDVMAETLTLTTMAVGIGWWASTIRPPEPLTLRIRLLALLGLVLTSVLAGLATLAKLSGALAVIMMIVVGALSLFLPDVAIRRKFSLGLGIATLGPISVLVFVLLNPFVTAKPGPDIRLPEALATIRDQGPWDRLLMAKRHREEVSTNASTNLFPDDGLNDPVSKVAVVAVQGFGRFGLLGPTHSDSTVRFEVAQDWGLVIWGPLVLWGAFVLFGIGRRQQRAGAAPVAWAVLACWLTALAVVTAFIPLAWDRYLMPIQGLSCLLAASAIDVIVRVVSQGSRRLTARTNES